MTLNIDSPESAPALPRIAYFPVSFFSMIMGLSGFTLAWKAAAGIFSSGTDIWIVFAYATSMALFPVCVGACLYLKKALKSEVPCYGNQQLL